MHREGAEECRLRPRWGGERQRTEEGRGDTEEDEELVLAGLYPCWSHRKNPFPNSPTRAVLLHKHWPPPPPRPLLPSKPGGLLRPTARSASNRAQSVQGAGGAHRGPPHQVSTCRCRERTAASPRGTSALGTTEPEPAWALGAAQG